MYKFEIFTLEDYVKTKGHDIEDYDDCVCTVCCSRYSKIKFVMSGVSFGTEWYCADCFGKIKEFIIRNNL